MQSGRLLDLWLKRRPDDVRALLLRASLRQDINNCQQAVPDFRRVLELEPDCEEAQRGLASCLTESARLDEAASYWQELYRRHPADVEVRVNLSRCWSELGRVQEAKQALQAVLEERPDHLLALRGLGRIWLQQENPAEAVIWLRRAVRAAPKDYRSHLLLYQALHKQGETTEAEQHLDEANQLELHWQRLRQLTQHDLIARPQDVAVQSEIGIVLLALGYEEAGRNWLLSALRCDPLCRSAREALERVPLRNPSPEH